MSGQTPAWLITFYLTLLQRDTSVFALRTELLRGGGEEGLASCQRWLHFSTGVGGLVHHELRFQSTQSPCKGAALLISDLGRDSGLPGAPKAASPSMASLLPRGVNGLEAHFL